METINVAVEARERESGRIVAWFYFQNIYKIIAQENMIELYHSGYFSPFGRQYYSQFYNEPNMVLQYTMYTVGDSWDYSVELPYVIELF